MSKSETGIQRTCSYAVSATQSKYNFGLLSKTKKSGVVSMGSLTNHTMMFV